jgi:long-chain acyl-CoA synthetase
MWLAGRARLPQSRCTIFARCRRRTAIRSKRGARLSRCKFLRDGVWASLSWRQWYAASRAFGAALIHCGVQPGDPVALISGNRLEWPLLDLGVQLAGGVLVPIHPSRTAESIAFMLKDSAATVVVCEDAAQLGKVVAHWPELPALQRIVHID